MIKEAQWRMSTMANTTSTTTSDNNDRFFFQPLSPPVKFAPLSKSLVRTNTDLVNEEARKEKPRAEIIIAFIERI